MSSIYASAKKSNASSVVRSFVRVTHTSLPLFSSSTVHSLPRERLPPRERAASPRVPPRAYLIFPRPRRARRDDGVIRAMTMSMTRRRDEPNTHRHARVPGQVHQRVLQHAPVTGGQDETIAVEPLGVLRVVRHSLAEDDIAHRGAAHRKTRVTGVGLVDGVDGQETHGVNRIVDRVLGDARGGGDGGRADDGGRLGSGRNLARVELGAKGERGRGVSGGGGHRA